MTRPALAVAAALAACGDDDAPIAPDALAQQPDASGLDVAAVPPGCVPGRSADDRPDDVGLDQIRVLYVLPSDGIDRARDTSDQICNSVRAFASWFAAASGSHLRLDTHGGLLDVGFVRLARSDAELRGSDPNNTSIATGTAFVRERIELELEQISMIAPHKLYAVYYEGSSVYACGGGAWPPLIVDRVGAMYLAGLPPGQTVTCGDTRPWGQPSLVPSYIDYGMLHELVHSMGFVAQAAPNQHSSGHVFDASSAEPSRDLMYSPRRQGDPFWAIDATGGLVLDIHRDDYFANGSGGDLATMSLLAPLPRGARRPLGW